MTQPDVLVVGGGVIGCSIAYHLVCEGASVTLCERADLAGEASGAAAGMLAPISEAEEDGPLRRWGIRSLERFESLSAELREESRIDFEWAPCGLIRLAETAERATRLRGVAARTAEHDLRWLAPEQLSALVPGLAPGLHGALLSPREAHVRSPLLARAFGEAAARRGALLWRGVAVTGLRREGARVVGVETGAGVLRAGVVVVCAGSWTGELLRSVDPALALPVEPVRGQIVALDAPSPPIETMLWGSEAYLVPKLDGRIVVGATSDHAGFDRRVTAEGVRSLLAAAQSQLPGLARATFRGAWAGLRPHTPDGLPLIGPIDQAPGLIVAAGHYRTGVLLSPVTGRMVADGIGGKGWAEPAFLPDRFRNPVAVTDSDR